VKTESEAKRVSVYVGETDRHGGRPLYEALVTMLHAEGIAGATATRGLMGFGGSGRTHAAHLLDLAEDLPVTVVFVDSAEKVASVMPRVDEMVETGLVTIEDVSAIRYFRS
jgi:PII-like signaling protein